MIIQSNMSYSSLCSVFNSLTLIDDFEFDRLPEGLFVLEAEKAGFEDGRVEVGLNTQATEEVMILLDPIVPPNGRISGIVIDFSMS